MKRITSILLSTAVIFIGAANAVAADKNNKYMHISFDDVYSCLYDISVKDYNSVFENSFFKDLQSFHNDYGAVFTLNCFNTSTENTDYDISKLPDTYKSEFRENSDWLKFSFHAENDLSNYGDAGEGTNSDGDVTGDCADEIKASYNKFVSAIINAAGEESIDTVARLGYFAGTENNVKALMECEYGITGLLSADDTRVSYYLDTDANNYLLSNGEYYDVKNNIKMIQSQKRLEKVSDVQAELNTLAAYNGNIIEVFTHEQNYNSAVKSRLKAYLEWAQSSGYSFGYASDAMKERISVTNLGAENGKQSYKVQISAGEKGYLISALYNGGRLIGLQSKTAQAEQTITFDIPETLDNGAVKFFLWDGVNMMKPLSNAAVTEIDNIEPESSITLDRSTYPLYVGNSSITDFTNWDGYGSYFTLTATVNSEEYSESDIQWTINDDVAYFKSVNRNVVEICARRTGIAKATASLPDGARASCYIPVIDNASRLTVEKLSFNTDELMLVKGQRAELKTIIYPKDIYNLGILNTSLNWTTSDGSVATVADGVITAHSAGTATITATSADVGRTAQCIVTVTDEGAASEIASVQNDIVDMTVGETAMLNAETDSDVIWKSDNSYIADVDENGIVTAYSNSNVQNVSSDGLTVTETAGTVKIYATAVNGGQVAEYQIRIANSDIADEYLEPSSGVFGKTEYTPTTPTTTLAMENAKEIDVDEVYQIVPEADGDSKLLWIGTDENIATVDREGNIQGYTAGTITVYAIVSDGLTETEQTEFDALKDMRIPDIERLFALLSGKTYAQCTVTVKDDTPCLRNVHIPSETVTYESINILWNRASLLDMGDFEKYIVYQNGEKIAETTTLGYTLNNLEADTEYTFKISAVDQNGSEIASDTVTVTTKPAPAAILNVLDFGARGDGTTTDTYAIQKAINACPENGVVWLPEGHIYYSGALFLKSDMTFKVDGVIIGSIDPKDYPRQVTKWEGWRKTEQPASEWANTTEAVPDNHMPHASLINAGKYDEGVYGMTGPYNVENLVICGNGQINANGFQLGFNEGPNHTYSSVPWTSYKYPVNDPTIRGRAITIQNGQNIYIKDITVAYSPSWTVHTINCDNITFDGMEVVSQGNGDVGRGANLQNCGHIPNGDGIDPESCTNANIFNVFFTTGDDTVAMKTGRNKEGNELDKPNAYVRVTDCTTSWSLGGFGTGSENAGGAHDLLFQNLNVENVKFYGIWLKTQETRGGTTENVQIRDMKVKVANAAVNLDHNYGDSKNPNSSTNPADEKPVLRNITIENVVSEGTSAGIRATGLSSSYISDVKIRNYTNAMSTTVGSPLKYCKNFEIWDCVNTTWSVSNGSNINEYFTTVLEDTEIVKNEIAYVVQEISGGVITIKPDTTGGALIDDITSSKGGEQMYSFMDARGSDITCEAVLTDGCKLIVTSPNGEKTAEYTIAVKEAVNADITALSIKTNSEKELIFSEFLKTTTNYTIKAEKSAESITIAAVTDDSGAIVVMKNNGVEFTDTTELKEDGNVVTIVVTASDNSESKTYTINIDNSYSVAEDFTSVSDAWGFSGNGGASATDGVINLLTSKKTGDTVEKTLESDISDSKRVYIEFDWKNNASSSGYGSWFALHDSEDNMIFAIFGNTKYVGIGASTTNTGSGWETIESFSDDWYRVSLGLDFESNTINGTITNITDDKIVKTYTDEPIQNGASNLGKLYAQDGYQAAVISLDNIYIKDLYVTPVEPDEPEEMTALIDVDFSTVEDEDTAWGFANSDISFENADIDTEQGQFLLTPWSDGSTRGIYQKKEFSDDITALKKFDITFEYKNGTINSTGSKGKGYNSGLLFTDSSDNILFAINGGSNKADNKKILYGTGGTLDSELASAISNGYPGYTLNIIETNDNSFYKVQLTADLTKLTDNLTIKITKRQSDGSYSEESLVNTTVTATAENIAKMYAINYNDGFAPQILDSFRLDGAITQ